MVVLTFLFIYIAPVPSLVYIIDILTYFTVIKILLCKHFGIPYMCTAN